jgi:hypothetical protein
MTVAKAKLTSQTVKLEPELLRRLKIHSAYTDLTHQDIIHSAIVEYLDHHKDEAKEKTSRGIKISPEAMKTFAQPSPKKR